MEMLNEDIRKQLKEIFEGMKNDVTIALFTKEEPCETCEETESFMKELVSTSEKLHFKQYDINVDKEITKEYGVELTPSIVLLDNNEEYKRIKFNGIPAGHEINSLIAAILEVSGNSNNLPKPIEERLKKVIKPINIKVFVTLSCPHCPGAVEKAHKLALENPNINAEMIEAQTFYDLSDKYNVSSVPKIVINDKYEFVGNQPFEEFLNNIDKANAVA